MPGTGPTEPGARGEGHPSEARLGPDELSRVGDPHSPGGLRNQATAQRTELYHARWPWHSSPWASRWQPGQSLGRPGACPHLRPGGGQTRVSGTVTQASAGVDCGLPPGPGSWQGSPDAHGKRWPAPVLVFGPDKGGASSQALHACACVLSPWTLALGTQQGRGQSAGTRLALRPTAGLGVCCGDSESQGRVPPSHLASVGSARQLHPEPPGLAPPAHPVAGRPPSAPGPLPRPRHLPGLRKCPGCSAATATRRLGEQQARPWEPRCGPRWGPRSLRRQTLHARPALLGGIGGRPRALRTHVRSWTPRRDPWRNRPLAKPGFQLERGRQSGGKGAAALAPPGLVTQGARSRRELPGLGPAGVCLSLPPPTPRPSRLSQGSCWEPVNLHGSVRGRSSGGWGRGPGRGPS